jgi:hypothetical protein
MGLFGSNRVHVAPNHDFAKAVASRTEVKLGATTGGGSGSGGVFTTQRNAAVNNNAALPKRKGSKQKL